MRISPVFALLTAGLSFCPQALPQSLPPSAIGSLNIKFNILGGNGINLANRGTATGTFTSAGSFAFLDVSGTVTAGQYGTYTYSVVSDWVARITYRYDTGVTYSQVTTLNFLSRLAGTYSAVAGAGTAYGTFTLQATDPFAPLMNISNRLQVAAGQTVIAGFVVGGPISRRVLLRAIGPSLQQFGVGDAIRATTMTVYSGSTAIATNTGWTTDPSQVSLLSQAFAATGAFALGTTALDSAVVLSLAPGAYTCSVAGVSPSDSGSVLIEVYYLQSTDAAAEIALSFPLRGYTPYTAPIVSVFDHAMADRFARDGRVITYKNELGDVPDLVESPNPPHSFKKPVGANSSPAFVVNGNYVGTQSTGASTINYDGHPGYDYRVPNGTNVYASADGWVETVNLNPADSAGIYVRIQHDPVNYQTSYMHLSQVEPLVTRGARIARGSLIGKSGSTGEVTGAHLHFEVKKLINGLWRSVDPYGWEASGPDPYFPANIRLWE